MPGWRAVYTPGHTAGHVSIWREHDRTLIAGDAVVTTKQESLLAVMAQRPELHGPPAYFTQDWERAAQSVRTIAALEPEVLATGHGIVMRGDFGWSFQWGKPVGDKVQITYTQALAISVQ